MRRGEVWLTNLEPTLGAEIRKTRPVIIISSDAIGILPLRVVVPLTDWKERYEQAAWMVKINPDAENGLGKVSSADTFQIRSLSTNRLMRKIGEITPSDLENIVQAVALVIEYQFKGGNNA